MNVSNVSYKSRPFIQHATLQDAVQPCIPKAGEPFHYGQSVPFKPGLNPVKQMKEQAGKMNFDEARPLVVRKDQSADAGNRCRKALGYDGLVARFSPKGKARRPVHG
jgi:hypothetical protein